MSYSIQKDPKSSTLPWRIVDASDRMLIRYPTRKAATLHLSMLAGDLSGAPEWYRLALAHGRRRMPERDALRYAAGSAAQIGLSPSQVNADPDTGAPLEG